MTSKSPVIEVVPAALTHVGPLHRRLREIDRRECAIVGHTGKQALRLGLIGSTLSWTFLVDGRPEAMMGVVTTSLLDREGAIWLLATDEAAQQKRAFVRFPQRFLPAIHKVYSVLHNRVHTDNQLAIRWLEYLGFEIGPTDGQGMREFRRCVTRLH